MLIGDTKDFWLGLLSKLNLMAEDFVVNSDSYIDFGFQSEAILCSVWAGVNSNQSELEATVSSVNDESNSCQGVFQLPIELNQL